MSALAQTYETLDIQTLEDTLMMRSWGVWAKDTSNRRYPGWVYQIEKDAWRVEANPPPTIDEDYAMELDQKIAQLPDRQKAVLIGLYVARRGLMDMTRVLRTTKRVVQDERAAALNILYGALKMA